MAKMDISRKTAVLLAALGLVLLGLVIVFFTGGEREDIRHASDKSPVRAKAADVEPAPTRTVTLFFLSDGDDLLHGEKREIPVGPSASEEAERALAELINGSARLLVSPLPPEAQVRQVFVTKDGIAHVDFGKEITEKASWGSSSELAAVYAVVDTLAFNFKEIKRVSILVEGVERETLGGHVDLARAFLPNYSLVAK